MSKELTDALVQLVKDGGATAFQIVLVIQIIGYLKVATVVGSLTWGLVKIAGAIKDAARSQ